MLHNLFKLSHTIYDKKFNETNTRFLRGALVTAFCNTEIWEIFSREDKSIQLYRKQAIETVLAENKWRDDISSFARGM